MEKHIVFQGGREGYHTYRIPSIISTKKGKLIAFAEGRKSRHDAAQNDLVYKISNDKGKTWSPLKILVSEGKDSLNNPQPVIERETGIIFLMYQRTPHPYKERDVTEGFEGKKVSHTYLIQSKDKGESWTKPRKITQSVKRPEKATTTAAGPGIGIQLTQGKFKGRLIMPFNQGPWGKWKAYAVYSDDQGKTWQYGETAEGKANEVQMVELSDGSVMLNARTYGRFFLFLTKNKNRVIGISKDGGKTWSKLRKDKTLIEPNCQGSIIRYNFPHKKNSNTKTAGRILFCNPASKIKRKKGTVRVSYDDGKNWPKSKVLCPGHFAYSCLVVLDDGTIGCLYETGDKNSHERLEFTRFDIDWLES